MSILNLLLITRLNFYLLYNKKDINKMAKSIILEEILADFLKEVPDLIAAFVVDYNGLIIAKNSIKDFDDLLIGGITTVLDQTLERIKRFTQTQLGSGSFIIDEFRLFYIELGKATDALLVVMGNPYSNLDHYIQYAHIIADKISSILSECKISSFIPKLKANGDLDLKPNSKNILLIGPEAVGKTALAEIYTNNYFIEKHKPTIGISIFEKYIQITNENRLILNIFDLASLKSFGKIRRYFYKYADAVLIVFDYSCLETLIEIEDWINEARQFISERKIPFVIIGNKVDLLEINNEIRSQALNLAERYNYLFYETSVKNHEGVDEVFDYLSMKEFLDYDKTMIATPITFKNMSEDERIIFISEIDSNSLEKINIPNVLEKNIIINIAKSKEISLALLLKKLAPLKIALNREIDRKIVLKVLEKYIQKRQIIKRYLEFEEDLELFNRLKTIEKSDI